MTQLKNMAHLALRATVGALFITATSVTFAQNAMTPNTPKIDAREQRQDARIDQGVASGQLTTKEAARLDARETRIQQMEASAKADGKVTKAERSQIRHAQNNTSKAIYRQKHDGQVDLNHDGKRDKRVK
jgi:uncharacterized membrane protein YebE (DUF533 family)